MRIVVVGAGLMGVTSAWFLARDGHEVTVLDQADRVAAGASQANAGMLTPSMADPWNAPGVFMQMLQYLGKDDAPLLLRLKALPSLLTWGPSFVAHSRPARFHDNMARNLRLAMYSLSVMRELRATLDLVYDQRTAGTIKVFRGARALQEGIRRCEQLASLGLIMNTLDPKALIQLEPALSDVSTSIAGAIHFPEDESGDARQFTEAMSRHAQQAGVDFRFAQRVTGFERKASRVTAVVTQNGPLPADAVVIAAGSWSPLLLAKLGQSLPVRPVKGYSVTVPFAGWTHAPRLPVVDDALHAAITPLGNRLRVAGTAEITGYDTVLTPSRINNLFDLLLAVYPSFEPHLDRNQSTPWAGLRPVSVDGVPFIGKLGLENLYVNTGHGHLGWTLAAGSSHLLADLMLGRQPRLDPQAYRAKRR